MENKYKEVWEADAKYLSVIIQKFNFNKQAFKKQNHCKVTESLSPVELST